MYQVSHEPFLVDSYGAILFWQEHRGNLSGKQADVSNSLFLQSCMWEKFRGHKDSMDHLLQPPINAGPKKVKMAFR